MNRRHFFKLAAAMPVLGPAVIKMASVEAPKSWPMVKRVGWIPGTVTLAPTDWRYAVRICNIDVSTLVAAPPGTVWENIEVWEDAD